MMEKRTFLFILNPISGLKKNKKSIEQIIHKEFQAHSTIDYQIQYTQFPGHARQLAREAAAQNVSVVVAVGGDGTMNEVASSLVGTETVLGIIPRGSGNGYARSLKIPLKVKQAIRVLQYGQVKQVDVGKINEFYFFGVAGVGFDAYIGAQFQAFGLRGPLPYFYIGVREYFRYSYEGFTLKFNGQSLHVNPLLITVANTPQYGMNATIAPQAKVDDGILELCVLNPMSVFKAAMELHHLFDGTIEKVKAYRHFSVKEVEIEREYEKGVFHTDGEPRMGPRVLKISVLPQKIKVLVPGEKLKL
ncbi:diacylglycerol/lipid kinase family protein [Caldithrix abyssi]